MIPKLDIHQRHHSYIHPIKTSMAGCIPGHWGMFKPTSMLANGLSLQNKVAADHEHSLAHCKYPSGP